MKSVMSGTVAGLAGTTVMTGAMFLTKKAGMVPGELEPKEIAGNLEEKIGVRDYLPEPAFEASWTVLHFGYGTLSGVAYALAQKVVLDPKRPVLIGLPFGALLWTFGYCIWLPVCRLYPPPAQVPKRKVAANILTHMVYGIATATAHRVLWDEPEG